MTAADTLRASVAALPEHQRTPWEYRATSVYMNGTSYGSVVANPHTGPSPASSVTCTAGQHIALTASPDVVTALADLLDALHGLDDEIAAGNVALGHIGARHVVRALTTRDALEQEITRRSDG